MLLAIDIGNSNVVLSLFHEGIWGDLYRLDSMPHRSTTEYIQFISDAIATFLPRIDTVIISSVVPSITTLIDDAVRTLVSCSIMHVSPSMPSPLAAAPPHEIGQDLFANAVASYTRSNIMSKKSVIGTSLAKPTASISIDMGTALTFIAVDSKGYIRGVAIAPGLETSYKALIGNTAQITNASLTLPHTALGSTTKSALDGGIIMGFSFLIKGMVAQITKELQEDTKVYATGGFSPFLKPLVESVVDEFYMHLTLDGLRILAEYSQHTEQ